MHFAYDQVGKVLGFVVDNFGRFTDLQVGAYAATLFLFHRLFHEKRRHFKFGMHESKNFVEV